MIAIYLCPGGFTVPLRITPRGGRQAVLPFVAGDEVVKLRVTAAPAEGLANRAVIELLSKTLHLPRRAFVIQQGAASRNKVLRIEGDAADTLGKFAAAMEVSRDTCFEIRERHSE